MAAIDKFDAMMSKGNVYAPDGMDKLCIWCRIKSHSTSFLSTFFVHIDIQSKDKYLQELLGCA